MNKVQDRQRVKNEAINAIVKLYSKDTHWNSCSYDEPIQLQRDSAVEDVLDNLKEELTRINTRKGSEEVL